MVAARNRVGRNDKCPCGSGEKYKRCCWTQREKHFNQYSDSGFSQIEPSPPRNRISPETPLDADRLKNEWMELQLDIPLNDGTLLSIIGFQSAFWIKTHGVDIGSNVDVNLPIISYVGPAILTEIRPAEWTPEREGEVKAVFHCEDKNEGGLLVLGARRSPTKGCFAERCANIRFVSLQLIEYKGNMARQVDLTMLRSLEWLNKHNARIGGSVYAGTDLQGWAKIQNIEPCLSAEEMSEQKEFGEFKPWSGRVGDLKIASESEPIGVTPSHPFRSHDRNDWVAAGRLEPGERVKTLDGTSVVEWYVMREKPEAVYNIEVEGDHVYRVGQSGILVHNASAGRVTDTSRVGDASLAANNCIVTDSDIIKKVIGSELTATGRHTTLLGGILQFILRGRGAGFLGVTRDAVDRTDLVFMRIQGSSSTEVVIVAIDLSKVDAATVYTPDTPVGDPSQPLFDALVAEYPNSTRMINVLPNLRAEGWTAIDGRIPSSAIVKLLKTTTTVGSATINPLLKELFS